MKLIETATDEHFLSLEELASDPHIKSLRLIITQTTPTTPAEFDDLIIVLRSLNLKLDSQPQSSTIQDEYDQHLEELLHDYPWLDQRLANSGRILNTITARIRRKDPGTDPTDRRTNWNS